MAGPSQRSQKSGSLSELLEQRRKPITAGQNASFSKGLELKSGIQDPGAGGAGAGAGGGMDAAKIQAAGQAVQAITGGSGSGGSQTDTGSAVAQGITTGAVTGGTLGSMIAPGVGTAVGAGVGAAVGAVGGVLQARAARKKEARDAQAQALRNIADIQLKQGEQTNVALSNIIEGFRSAMVRR